MSKPVTKPPDERSILAMAAAWSAHVTMISLEMVLPGVLGFWIDQHLGTVMVFLVLGAILGMTTGILHLVRLTASPDGGEPPDRRSPDDSKR